MNRKKEIVIAVTGGISAYKACDLVRIMRKSGFNVSVIMTKEAVNFVRPLTFQALSGNKVYVDMFEETMDWNPKHVSLADKADIIAVVPATANFIGKLANGIYDDLPSCVCCAAAAKIILCPAMNANMYANKIVKENIAKLKKAGFIIEGPVKGRLASGKIGMGHLSGVEDIAGVIKKHVR